MDQESEKYIQINHVKRKKPNSQLGEAIPAAINSVNEVIEHGEAPFKAKSDCGYQHPLLSQSKIISTTHYSTIIHEHPDMLLHTKYLPIYGAIPNP